MKFSLALLVSLALCFSFFTTHASEKANTPWKLENGAIKNYYQTLEIDQNAKLIDIANAFEKKNKMFVANKNEDKRREAQEALSVLYSLTRRTQYNKDLTLAQKLTQ